MVRKVFYVEFAVNDLASIYNYISRDSIKYARLEVKKIKAFAETIKYHPLKGKFFEMVKGEEIRSIVFKQYIIFYSVGIDRINILTIHHHARLISNNPGFKDEDE